MKALFSGRVPRWLLLLIAVAVSMPLVIATSAMFLSQASAASSTFTLPPTAGQGGTGYNTGFVVTPTLPVTVSATGQVSCGGGPTSCLFSPNGDASVGSGTFLLPGAPKFSLIGKVGSGGWFFIGAGPLTVTGNGTLLLAVNDDYYADNSVGFSVTLSQNAPPVASNDGYSTNKGAALNVSAPGVLGNDIDVDGDTLTATKLTDPSNGAVTFNSNGSFTYTPNANFSGSDSFTYKANDGAVDSNVATVEVVVTCPNTSTQAALFTDPNYGGQCATLSVGSYPPGIAAFYSYIPNDTLSSLKVGSEVRLIGYDSNPFPAPPGPYPDQGASGSFTADDADLADNGLSDIVSSVRVEKRVGNDVNNRNNLDSFQNFVILDGTISDTGILYRVDYYAGNTNSIRFLLTDASNVVRWLSGPIIPASIGRNSFELPSPGLGVFPGWRLGVYFSSSGTVPFEYTGSTNVSWTNDNTGLPTMGSTLALAGSGTRQYSFVSGVLPQIVTSPVVSAAATQSAISGASASISLGSFADPDNGGWSVKVDWGDSSNETFTVGTTGSLGSRSHTYSSAGNKTVTVTVTDATLLSGSATFQVNVEAPNVAPTVDAGGPYSVNEGSSVTVVGTGTDPDGDAITYSWDLDNNGSYETPGQNVNFSAVTRDGPGSQIVKLQGCDPSGACSTDTATVNINNVAPELTIGGANSAYYVDWIAANPGAGTASGVITLPDASTVGVEFKALNPDGVTPSFYYGAQTNGGINYWNPSAPYISSQVPNAPPDPDIIQLSGGTSTIYKVTLSAAIVDPIMAIVSLGNGSTPTTYDFDSPFTVVSQGAGYWGTGPFEELPGDILRGAEGHGTIKFLGTFTTFSWTVPTPEVWHGFTFAIRATEANAETVFVNEGQTANNSGTWSDVSADTVTLSASSGTVTKNTDGTWDWSLATTDGPTIPASQTISITASDEDGGSTIKTFPLVVSNVNPTVTINGAPATSPEGTAINLTSTVTDPGTPETFSYAWSVIKNSSPYGTGGTGANFSFTPDDNGTYMVSLTVGDGDGGTGSDGESISVTNVAPNAVDDTATTNEDSPVDISVLSNDTDIPADTLTVTVVTQGAHGSVSIIDSGTKVRYTPAANFSGSDSFTYTIGDGDGGSDTATVAVNVTPMNDVPVANNDSYSTNEDTALTVSAPGVLGNDTDVEGFVLTAVLVSSTSNGALTLNLNGSFSYTPNLNFNGSDSFTYKANDGTADSNVATVTITVNAINDAPVAVNDSYSTNEDTTLTVLATSGVLGNDTDVDNSSLTAIKVSDPANGTLTLNANGSFTYIPNANYNGSDSFTYKANDGTADSNVATVNITVNPVNDLPTVTRDQATVTVNEGSPATNTGTYGDLDGDTVTLSASVGSVAPGPGAGQWTWSFASTDGATESQAVTITATEQPSGTPVATTFALTVNNVNPSVNAGSDATIIQGQTFTGTGNFTDPGADTWSATVDYGDGSGPQTLSLNPDKTFALSNFYANPGSYIITVTVTDDDLGSGTDTVSLTVQALTVPGMTGEQAAFFNGIFTGLTNGVPGDDPEITDALGAVATALQSGNLPAAETALHLLNQALGEALVEGDLTILEMATLITYSGTIEGALGLGPQISPEQAYALTQINTPMFIGAATMIEANGGFASNMEMTQALFDAAFAIIDGNFLAAETALHALNDAAGDALIAGTLDIQEMATLITYSGTIEGALGLGPQISPEQAYALTQINTPMFIGAATMIEANGGFASNMEMTQALFDAAFAIIDGNFLAAETALHVLNDAAGDALIAGTLDIQEMATLITYSGTIEGALGLGPQISPEQAYALTQINTPMFIGIATMIQALPGGLGGNLTMTQALFDAGFAIIDGNFLAAETALHTLNNAAGSALTAGTLTLQQMADLITMSGTIEYALGLGPQIPPEQAAALTAVNTPAFLGIAGIVDSLPGGFGGNLELTNALLQSGFAIIDGNFAAAETQLHLLNEVAGDALVAGDMTVVEIANLLRFSATIEKAIGEGSSLSPEQSAALDAIVSPAFISIANTIAGLSGGFAGNPSLTGPLLEVGFALADGDAAAYAHLSSSLAEFIANVAAQYASGGMSFVDASSLLTQANIISTALSLGLNSPPLVGTLSGPVSRAEGQSGDYTFTAFDANSDSITASPSCGTGGTLVPGSVIITTAGTDTSGSFQCSFPDGSASTNVSIYVTDSNTAISNTRTLAVAVDNVDPEVAISGAPSTSPEGTSISLGSTVTDAGAPEVFGYSWNVTKNGTPYATGSVSSFSFTPNDDGAYVVTLSVGDGDGGNGTDSKTITVANVDPVIAGVTGPTSPLAAPASAIITVNYTDPGSNDTHNCVFSWDDSSADTTSAGSGGSCTATHSYTNAGVYKVSINLTDDNIGSAISTFEYVVVYDPSSGFVTGGGWVMSPSGAYKANPSLTGKATFGFVSKYQKGAEVPSGNTEFQFHPAGVNFKSSTYQWLVVAGAKAMFKGEGTLNGVAGHKFILTATDGQLPGGGGTDKFRIKITKDDIVVYDNGSGTDDLDSSTPQAIGGGSIVIHEK